MQGTIRIRKNARQAGETWRTVFTTSDPLELDREADRHRRIHSDENVQVLVSQTRAEKTQLTRAVLKREGRRCYKCGSTVDVKVVSIRYQEYHNPEQLTTLCRACRHARWRLEQPYEETVVRAWLTNGKSGVRELAEHFRSEYPERAALLIKQLGVEGANELIENQILETMFGANPAAGKALSPRIKDLFKERVQDSQIPDVFSESEDDSG